LEKELAKIQNELIGGRTYSFSVGDTVEVSSKVVEGDKERIQMFRGIVIKIHGKHSNKTVTVRKISEGVGVEKIYPLYSPAIKGIKVVKEGRVRRAKLYYLRGLTGKKATAIRSKIRSEQAKELIGDPVAAAPAQA
jgi:large subunit ribosomal protein L19